MSVNPHEKHRSRMRERFIKTDMEGFSPHEVLEVLLYYGYPRRDTNEIAHRLIREYGSLHALMDADISSLMQHGKLTQNVAVLIAMIPKIAKAYHSDKWKSGTVVLDSPEAACEYVSHLFFGSINESFFVICLDASNRLKKTALISQGTVDQTSVYVREIVAEAIKTQAVSIIMVHNHPGGTPLPSRQDKEVTQKVYVGLSYLSIRLLDHIIVAGDNYYSFAKRRNHHVEGYY